MSDYDLVIRNGQVIDGSGGPAFAADVAVKGGRIAKVGVVSGRGAEEIDATGKIVTPGFVDIHTHYDGQATWEHRLAPSSNHGVTTVVAGNCGVGFAPCRPQDRRSLVKLMEGVEDVPEVVMTEGLPWNWETFPEYLDSLAARNFDIDVALHVPHAPIRVYAMGERGANREPSTEADRRAMTHIVTEAIQAGALGVSTSRSINHRATDGTLSPCVTSTDEELDALARGVAAAGAGVVQVIVDTSASTAGELAAVTRLAEVSKRPVSFSVFQVSENPEGWRDFLDGTVAANAAGHDVRAQVIGRPVGLMLGLDLSINPLITLPSYRAIAHLPLAERVAILRDPAFKAKVLAEEPVVDPVNLNNALIRKTPMLCVLGAEPDYAPAAEKRVGEMARAAGVDPLSLAYDLMLEQDGHAILSLPIANFAYGNLDVAREMMAHPHTVLGLGDGGAHYGLVCDAAYPTHLLTYWVQDAPEGQRFSMEWAINALTRRPAETVGLLDRGLVAEGLKADLNVIDPDRLKLYSPHPVYNLPAGGRRLQQKADGYEVIIVGGEVTYREGEPTGALPGRLVRGPGYRPERRAAA